jgi:cell division protein FtsI/penicillin-binding protein 2
VLTVAAALEEGVVTPDWTYVDQGVFPVGGEEIRNWDGVAHGVVDLTTALVDSLNIGMATIAVNELGREAFYARIGAFGIGERTRVDLEGEEAGNLRIPGDPVWSESDLATNSFGQGVAVTPLQMLNAVNTIANGGLLMQPRVVAQVVRGTEIENREPVVIRRVLSPETARIVREMMIRVVNDGVDGRASVPGYTVAGKTGTAQIFTPIGPDTRNMMTFIGLIPGDDPQISVLVKLDRPTSGQFASQTAAPVFARLAERLVLMLEIPTDEVRAQLAAKGGVIGGINR